MRTSLQYLLISISVLLSLPTVVHAMELYKGKFHGREALYAVGPIEFGDADKYKTLMSAIPAQPDGSKLVILNSPGGYVTEAFKIANTNSRYRVHTHIPQNAICASACASILFLSGDYRTMHAEAKFGQHSCSNNGVANQACNDELAEYAYSRGVEYGSVASFVTFAPPEDMAWLNKYAVDCNGLSKYPFSDEVGFQIKPSPCIFNIVRGEFPKSQSKWRIELHKDGYRAFVRPVNDVTANGEIGLFCNENVSGTLFLDVLLKEPAHALRTRIEKTNLLYGDGRKKVSVYFRVEPAYFGYSKLTLKAPRNLTMELLTKSKFIGAEINMVGSNQPILLFAPTSSSKKALIFAANHCLNRLQ